MMLGIDVLDEGYVLQAPGGKRYAATEGNLVDKIHELRNTQKEEEPQSWNIERLTFPHLHAFLNSLAKKQKPDSDDGRVQGCNRYPEGPNEPPKCSEKLNGLAKQAMDAHNHIPVEEKAEKPETTREKVLKEAKDQIDITGKVGASEIARILGLTPATIAYHLGKLSEEIEAYKAEHEEGKYKPRLRTDTSVPEDEKHLENVKYIQSLN
jgi:DNA-binding transcriptional ArsR family regulator